MTPMTSFEKHRAVIERLQGDGEFFARGGYADDAERVRRDIAELRFDACTLQEIAQLMAMQSRACAAVSDKMGATA